MLLIYITFLCIPLALILWYKRPEFWVSLSFCSAVILAYVIAVPNVGSLYRMRYGYLMTVVGLALAAGIKFLRTHRRIGPAKS